MVSDFTGRSVDRANELRAALSPDIPVEVDDSRSAGKGYYPSTCFKLFVRGDVGPVEVGDGGLVDWSQALLSNKKERMVISGLGLERVAQLASAAPS
jgi:hypothetical protein